MSMIKKSDSVAFEPSFEDFKMIMVLGRGAFGKVYLGKLTCNGEDKSQKLYAIKSIRKDILIDMD